MPKIVQRYKDNLILCCTCQRYLPKESFFELGLRKRQFQCKECHRKYVNEYNHGHGTKTWEERKKEQEENRQKELEKKLLENPFEQINKTIERLVKERGEYQQKEDNVCGFCHQLAYLGFNQRYFCKRHWLVEALSMGRPLPISTQEGSPELVRKLGLLKELEDMGVKV